ncbi:DUF2993 domain-containing protein [Streptomyces sp. GC420]|uniref:LmeA family phospholipid-binding protein n=1 Tax=Streptomyces sp. GC420 TaxID=2697568 RepID=UPI001414F888|nr:DUF2993 domain-containing protein [Streptomyces sp. GC420]NBM18257.1 LmeA family phospholipid-binding protein [Streptomyces sp. GC420]
MRALRILLIIAVILGGLFVAVDRLAVNYAENEAAERLRANEGLAESPTVSIAGFPFLTQVLSGELDEVDATISDFKASGQGEAVVIDELTATMRGVVLADDYSSATAERATGSAVISYDELLKAARAEPVEIGAGITARVTKLSDGGNGKIKVGITADVPVIGERDFEVLSTVKVVDGDTVEVHADTLPDFPGAGLADQQVRRVTDFEEKITELPRGIALEKVTAGADGVRISVTGSQVALIG